MSEIIVSHVVPGVGRQSFGLAPSPLHLTRWQRHRGVNATVECCSNESELDWASETSGCPRWALRGHGKIGHSNMLFSPGLAQSIVGGRFNVLHQHGTWTLASLYGLIWTWRQRQAYILSPQGSFSEWALAKSRTRKKIAWNLYQKAGLMRATAVHAVAEAEIHDVRQLGYKGPIAVIPNGIENSWLHSIGDGAGFRARSGISPASKCLLFLSRISPKKGLPMLLTALSRIRTSKDDWNLVIAGVDEFGHESEVRECVKALGLQHKVHFAGPLFDQAKRDALAAADLFVLPSFSEGAPFVVLEALGASVPVLTTRGSPWAELVTANAGWWVEPTVGEIESALVCAISTSPKVLREMGARGRSLVEQDYSWEKLADKSIELYRWLLTGGVKPAFVHTL